MHHNFLLELAKGSAVAWTESLPIVSIVVPFWGVCLILPYTSRILNIDMVKPKEERQFRLQIKQNEDSGRPELESK